MGGLSRSEIHERYGEIDVVVCPSREETASIVVTEGMMYGKVCIVSEVAGMAAYIEDGENGIICESENHVNLCDKMKWVIKNRKNLQTMGKRARETYEKYFSMESFGERLEKELHNAIAKHTQRD